MTRPHVTEITATYDPEAEAMRRILAGAYPAYSPRPAVPSDDDILTTYYFEEAA